MRAPCGVILILSLCLAQVAAAADLDLSNARRPTSDDDLSFWLQNMVWHHQFTTSEIREATGLVEDEISTALMRFDIRHETKPRRDKGASILALPYPGGRHPRIGFRDGAVHPQRETKISVFTPWDDSSYVVVDVPEAIWSNLGLTYLAHSHVPTIWSKQNIELPKLEWNRRADGSLGIERKLPNGIEFACRVVPSPRGVRMKLTLTNGSSEKLSDLRVQNCVMLKGAKGFEQQTNDNKLIQSPYIACKNESADRWIITAWQPIHRPWANPPCPCLHADPKFPDCPPGGTRVLHGWLSFYEGNDVELELKRLDTIGWDRDE